MKTQAFHGKHAGVENGVSWTYHIKVIRDAAFPYFSNMPRGSLDSLDLLMSLSRLSLSCMFLTFSHSLIGIEGFRLKFPWTKNNPTSQAVVWNFPGPRFRLFCCGRTETFHVWEAILTHYTPSSYMTFPSHLTRLPGFILLILKQTPECFKPQNAYFRFAEVFLLKFKPDFAFTKSDFPIFSEEFISPEQIMSPFNGLNAQYKP